MKNLNVLDLTNNKIDFETDEEVQEFLEILKQMDSLGVLYLTGNKVIRKIRNYRKTLIVGLPNLKYLDDRPVFPEDRRYAEAFHRGGLEEERLERKKVRQEKEEAHARNHEAFRQMIERNRNRRAERDTAENPEAQAESDSTSDQY